MVSRADLLASIALQTGRGSLVPTESEPTADLTPVDLTLRELRIISELLSLDIAGMGVPPMTFPNTGGKFALPPGENKFDFRNGLLTLGDGTTTRIASFGSRGIDMLLSFHIWVDSDADVQATFKGQPSGFWELDQCVYSSAQAIPYDALIIRLGLPADVRMVLGVGPRPNFAPAPVVTHQDRFAEETSVNAQTAMRFRATGAGIQDAELGRTSLHVSNIGSKVFLIENTHATASIDVQLQLRHLSTGVWFADPDTGGAVTAIAAGNTAILETGLACHLMRLLLSSTVADTPGTCRVQYHGVSMMR